MKHRNLLTYVFYAVILLALAGFLIAEFVMKDDDKMQKVVAAVSLGAAILSVALVDIVFPILDNKDMLKNKKYLILMTVKIVFFVAATTVLFLYTPFKAIKSTAVALIIFVVLYFIQYFISLDPKIASTHENDEDLEEIKADDEDTFENMDDDISSDDIEIEIDDGIIDNDFTIDFGDKDN